jgi:hypothetical protein
VVLDNLNIESIKIADKVKKTALGIITHFCFAVGLQIAPNRINSLSKKLHSLTAQLGSPLRLLGDVHFLKNNCLNW